MRKVCGECLTCDKSVARTVHRDRKTEFTGAPAEISRIIKHRVQDQWLAAVVGTDRERDAAIPVDRIPASNLPPFALHILVDHRFLQLHFATRNAQHQIAVRVDVHLARAVHFHDDGLWIGSRRHHEVILQSPLIAIKNKVHARINAAVSYLRVRRHIGVPLARIIADEIVRSPRQFVHPRDPRIAIRPFQPHANRCYLPNASSFALSPKSSRSMERR